MSTPMTTNRPRPPAARARRRARLLSAARSADWIQVVLNQGPPCFHLLPGARPKFCLAAQRWPGHDAHHKFVSLEELLKGVDR